MSQYEGGHTYTTLCMSHTQVNAMEAVLAAAHLWEKLLLEVLVTDHSSSDTDVIAKEEATTGSDDGGQDDGRGHPSIIQLVSATDTALHYTASRHGTCGKPHAVE